MMITFTAPEGNERTVLTMDVREKLVELIESARYWGCGTSEEIAKNLIANGVTVQEWISVKDRLPEEGEYVLCVLKGFNYGGKIQVCKFVPADKFKDKPYFEHFRNGFPSVTHWMPMPELPKGE